MNKDAHFVVITKTISNSLFMALKLCCSFPLELGPFLFGCFYHHHCVPRTAMFQREDTHVTSEKMLERETCHPQGFYFVQRPPWGLAFLIYFLACTYSISYPLISKSSRIFSEDPLPGSPGIYCSPNLNCLVPSALYIADISESLFDM